MGCKVLKQDFDSSVLQCIQSNILLKKEDCYLCSIYLTAGSWLMPYLKLSACCVGLFSSHSKFSISFSIRLFSCLYPPTESLSNYLTFLFMAGVPEHRSHIGLTGIISGHPAI